MFFYFSILHMRRLRCLIHFTVSLPAGFKLWCVIFCLFCCKILIVRQKQREIEPCYLFGGFFLFFSCISFSFFRSTLASCFFFRFIFFFEERSSQYKRFFLDNISCTLLFLTLDVCLFIFSDYPIYQLLRSGWYFFSSQPWLLGHSILSGQPESSMDFIYPLVQWGHISGWIE